MAQAFTVIVKGVVIPVEWDERGNPTAAALAADDEQEYRISGQAKSDHSILLLLRRRVRIEGCLVPTASTDKHNTIKVDGYRVLDGDQV